MNSRLLTTEEVAAELNLPLSSARALMPAMGAFKIGQQWRIRRQKVEDWKGSEAFDRYRQHQSTTKPGRRLAEDDLLPTKSGLYFVQCTAGARLIKIGRATNLRARIRGLRKANGVVLKVLAVCVGARRYSSEARIHAQFNELREHGEWFRSAPRLLKFIAELAS